MPNDDTSADSTTDWRRNHEIRWRMRQAAAYHARGLTLSETARRLGVSRPTVSRDLDRVHTLWWEERIDHANQERRAALASTTDVAAHAWRQLETPEVAKDPATATRLLGIILQAQRGTRLLADSISKHPDRGPRRPLPPLFDDQITRQLGLAPSSETGARD